MKKKDTPVNRNPVAKNAPEFCKARVFRDRKTYSRKDKYPDIERNHPVHEPYKREKVLLEDEEDYGTWYAEYDEQMQEALKAGYPEDYCEAEE